MDSLKVTGASFTSQVIVFMDMLPYCLGIAIAIMNIIYLYYKIRNEKESQMLAKMIADEMFSEGAKNELIDEINKSIDIPIISEKTEKAILEALWKVIKAVFYKKLGL